MHMQSLPVRAELQLRIRAPGLPLRPVVQVREAHLREVTGSRRRPGAGRRRPNRAGEIMRASTPGSV